MGIVLVVFFKLASAAVAEAISTSGLNCTSSAASLSQAVCTPVHVPRLEPQVMAFDPTKLLEPLSNRCHSISCFLTTFRLREH